MKISRKRIAREAAAVAVLLVAIWFWVWFFEALRT